MPAALAGRSGCITNRVAGVFLCAFLVSVAAAQAPLSTSFTYQGSIKLGGQPLNNTADFQFRLWDASAAGIPVGSIVAIDDVDVADGLFTVDLDFGVAAFNGDARWLEIAVRSPAGAGTFSTLSPRQAVSAAPYSLQTRGVYVDGAGNVGIGTVNPTRKLFVAGDALVQGVGGYDAGGETARLYLGDANASIRAVNGSGLRLSAFNAPDALVLQQGSGNFGIGTTAPTSPLHVVGSNPFPHARIAASASAPYGAFVSVDASATTGGKDYLIFSTGGTAEEGAGKLVFQNFTDGVEALAITASGDVGIGINTPQSQLHVAGTITAGEAGVSNGEIVLEDSAAIANNPGIRTNSDGDLILRTHSSVGEMIFESGNPEATHMTLLGNGHFGIGTPTPMHALDVAGRMNVANGVIQRGAPAITATSDLGLYSQTANTWMRFVTNNGPIVFFTNSAQGTAASPTPNSQAMTILANGRVGIGTTSSAAQLAVASASGRALQSYATSGDFAIGVYGLSDGNSGTGVYGDCFEGAGAVGVRGVSAAGYGVYGEATTDGIAVFGDSADGIGVEGRSISDNGVVGSSFGEHGVVGGGFGEDGVGVRGEAHNGLNARGVWGNSSSGYAGWFDGRVQVNGLLTKSGGAFHIDHPMDPENKTLTHSFVESPDMMNIYNGNVRTDSQGEAWIELPRYFETLNRDFRYQLTVVDEHDFARARVARKIEGNRFLIKTDRPDVEVSWQVTGVRQDPFAERCRIVVEQDKPEDMKGKYLDPKSYGLPDERGYMHKPFVPKKTTRPETPARRATASADTP